MICGRHLGVAVVSISDSGGGYGFKFILSPGTGFASWDCMLYVFVLLLKSRLSEKSRLFREVLMSDEREWKGDMDGAEFRRLCRTFYL